MYADSCCGVSAYQRPDEVSGWDANWLTGEVEL